MKLQRQMQVVAIPVFQFGVYSDSDLSFFNGPNMTFGGRTHTNGNLWLTPAGQLDLGDKVTVVGQVLREYLENGDYYTTGGYPARSISRPPQSDYNSARRRMAGPRANRRQRDGFSEYGAVSTTPNSPTWANAVALYNGKLENQVSQLSLTAAGVGRDHNSDFIGSPSGSGRTCHNPAEFNDPVLFGSEHSDSPGRLR